MILSSSQLKKNIVVQLYLCIKKELEFVWVVYRRFASPCIYYTGRFHLI